MVTAELRPGSQLPPAEGTYQPGPSQRSRSRGKHPLSLLLCHAHTPTKVLSWSPAQTLYTRGVHMQRQKENEGKKKEKWKEGGREGRRMGGRMHTSLSLTVPCPRHAPAIPQGPGSASSMQPSQAALPRVWSDSTFTAILMREAIILRLQIGKLKLSKSQSFVQTQSAEEGRRGPWVPSLLPPNRRGPNTAL